MRLFKVIAMSLASLVACSALAETSINLVMMTKAYFPEFRGNLELDSKEGNCHLSINLKDDKIVYDISTSVRNRVKFVSAVDLKVENVKVEDQGKPTGQGLYSYTKYFEGIGNTTLIKGLYFFEPSYEFSDIVVRTVSEQELFFMANDAGTKLKVREVAGDKTRLMTCLF